MIRVERHTIQVAALRPGAVAVGMRIIQAVRFRRVTGRAKRSKARQGWEGLAAVTYGFDVIDLLGNYETATRQTVLTKWGFIEFAFAKALPCGGAIRPLCHDAPPLPLLAVRRVAMNPALPLHATRQSSGLGVAP